MISTDNRTDQQTTNAALAALTAAGNVFALGQLWEINRGLLRSVFWRWYPANKDLAAASGMTVEDFEQEGYFAVQYAAQTYRPEEGSFSTWLAQAMQRQIGIALANGHRRTVKGKDGKPATIAADPLNSCKSLDMPIDAEDENAATLGDLQPDPAAAGDMQDVEERIYQEELHNALEEALVKLAEREERVVRARFYEQKTLKEIAAAEGASIERVRQISAKAFFNMRKNTSLRRWHDDVISTRAWYGTGFSAWKSGGSVEERAVEYIESHTSM